MWNNAVTLLWGRQTFQTEFKSITFYFYYVGWGFATIVGQQFITDYNLLKFNVCKNAICNGQKPKHTHNNVNILPLSLQQRQEWKLWKLLCFFCTSCWQVIHFIKAVKQWMLLKYLVQRTFQPPNRNQQRPLCLWLTLARGSVWYSLSSFSKPSSDIISGISSRLEDSSSREYLSYRGGMVGTRIKTRCHLN